MSRIGKLPIQIPAGVDVTVEGQHVAVKGPKGQLDVVIPSPIAVAIDGGQVVVTRPDDERQSRSLHGLSRTLIANNIIGVTEGYRKSLQIVGTGYRVVAKGSAIEFALGYSHPIVVDPCGWHLVRDRRPEQGHRRRYRQAGGRRGRRETAQASSARAL